MAKREQLYAAIHQKLRQFDEQIAQNDKFRKSHEEELKYFDELSEQIAALQGEVRQLQEQIEECRNSLKPLQQRYGHLKEKANSIDLSKHLILGKQQEVHDIDKFLEEPLTNFQPFAEEMLKNNEESQVSDEKRQMLCQQKTPEPVLCAEKTQAKLLDKTPQTYTLVWEQTQRPKTYDQIISKQSGAWGTNFTIQEKDSRTATDPLMVQPSYQSHKTKIDSPPLVHLKLQYATLVKDTKTFGKMDPQATIRYGKQTFLSQVCKSGGKTPSWDQVFTLFVEQNDWDVEVVVSDASEKEFVGSGKFLIDTFGDKEIQLMTKGQKKAGVVKLYVFGH